MEVLLKTRRVSYEVDSWLFNRERNEMRHGGLIESIGIVINSDSFIVSLSIERIWEYRFVSSLGGTIFSASKDHIDLTPSLSHK